MASWSDWGHGQLQNQRRRCDRTRRAWPWLLDLTGFERGRAGRGVSLQRSRMSSWKILEGLGCCSLRYAHSVFHFCENLSWLMCTDLHAEVETYAEDFIGTMLADTHTWVLLGSALGVISGHNCGNNLHKLGQNPDDYAYITHLLIELHPQVGSQVARMAHGLVLTVLFITSCGLFTPLIGSCLPICQIACLIVYCFALYFVVLTLDLSNIPSAISLGSQNSQGIRSGCGFASDCNDILSLMTWELCLNRKSVHSWMRSEEGVGRL